jgi:hypothetical protein
VVTTYQTLLKAAIPYRESQLERARADFLIGSYERFDFNQETGLLTFSSAGIPRVLASAQVLGSHSSVSETWLWSWENNSVLPELTAFAQRVRAYGEKHSITELTEAKFPASEDESWHLAAAGVYIVKAAMVYRCPVRIGSSFLAVESFGWAT